MSRRYVDSEPEFYFPEYWRAKADNVKQGSSDNKIGIVDEDGYDPVDHSTWCINELYKDLIGRGVCPEQARMVLPQNTMTEWIWTGSVAAFARIIKLREDGHTQKSGTQEFAHKLRSAVYDTAPLSFTALLGE